MLEAMLAINSSTGPRRSGSPPASPRIRSPRRTALPATAANRHTLALLPTAITSGPDYHAMRAPGIRPGADPRYVGWTNNRLPSLRPLRTAVTCRAVPPAARWSSARRPILSGRWAAELSVGSAALIRVAITWQGQIPEGRRRASPLSSGSSVATAAARGI